MRGPDFAARRHPPASTGATRSLPAVFSAIAERAAHLHQFVSGYATFAKLPVPRPERVQWQQFAADLKGQQSFALAAPLPELPGWFDRVQVEQALINLLQNAVNDGVRVDVVNIMTMDYGGGFPSNQMGQNAIQAGQSLFNQLRPLFPSRSTAQLWATEGNKNRSQ